MDRLRDLIFEYYRTKPLSPAEKIAEVNIRRQIMEILGRKEASNIQIVEFLNRTQDDILEGLPADHPMRAHRRYTDKLIDRRNTVLPQQSPLVAANRFNDNARMILMEAQEIEEMMPDVIRRSIDEADALFNQLRQLSDSPSLQGFHREREEMFNIIARVRVMINDAYAAAGAANAAQQVERVAQIDAMFAREREPAIPPTIPPVSPDALFADLRAERVDSKTLKQFRKMMECPICSLNIRNVRVVPCGHTICKSCAEKVVASQVGIKRCPICNQPRDSFNRSFHSKYLKYKTKYLQLKTKII